MAKLKEGEQIEHYRIDGVVAQGPMSSVFKGTDLRTNQPVAIKAPQMAAESDPVFFERFRREAEIGRKMDHPGVIKVFPREDRGGVYMVMEWVEGPLLRELMAQEGRIEIARAVKIATEICDALYYIHSRGVVHRDLKPENIVVLRASGGQDHVSPDNIKLIDFGIAGEEGARRLTFGKFSNLMGTPDYISPEQIQGKRGDARSDVYALGAILYEMVTGRPPFEGENALLIMNDRLVNYPVPPRELNPEIPAALAGDHLPGSGTRSPQALFERQRDGLGPGPHGPSGAVHTSGAGGLAQPAAERPAQGVGVRGCGAGSGRGLRAAVLGQQAQLAVVLKNRRMPRFPALRFRPSERLAILYFVYVALIAPFYIERPWRTSVVAVAVAAGFWLTHFLKPIVRDLIPLGAVLTAYREMDWFSSDAARSSSGT